MLDSTMPPDMGAEIRKLNSRIERLEMSARSVNQQRFIQMFPAVGALAPDTSITPQGVHAYYTDQTSYTNMLAGDFMSDGGFFYGSLYLWLPAAHSLSYRVRMLEYGATHVVIANGTASATGQVSFSSVAIPSTVFTNPDDRRNKFCRVDVDIRRDSGTGRVGVGIAGSPFTYPY